MKNWARKFNPHKTGYRTPALFRLRKNYQIKKIKTIRKTDGRRTSLTFKKHERSHPL